MGALAVVSLVMELAPKLISAGKSVVDLWTAAGGILKDAEANGGKVDPDAFARLQALVQVQMDTLHANAKEASQP